MILIIRSMSGSQGDEIKMTLAGHGVQMLTQFPFCCRDNGYVQFRC